VLNQHNTGGIILGKYKINYNFFIGGGPYHSNLGTHVHCCRCSFSGL